MFEPTAMTMKDGAPAVIRAAVADDAPALHALTVALVAAGVGTIQGPDELRSANATRQRLDEWYEKAEGLWLVADVGGRAVGDAKITRDQYSRVRHRGWFSTGIHPDYQSRGLGRALIDAAVDWAKAAGLERLDLGVFASNTRARALYESVGFKEEGVRRRFIRYEDGTYDDDVVMALLWD